MSSVPSPSDKISVESGLKPQGDGTEGTVDPLEQAPQIIRRRKNEAPGMVVMRTFATYLPYMGRNELIASINWMSDVARCHLRDGQPAAGARHATRS